MSPQIKSYITPEEYLGLERKAEYKSEYLNGEVFAMTGASRNHNLIAANIIGELNLQLRAKPCEVYPSDMRVKVTATGLLRTPMLWLSAASQNLKTIMLTRSSTLL